jgi:hypothetical protein
MLTANGLALTTGCTISPWGEELEDADGNFNYRYFNSYWEGRLLSTFSGTTLAASSFEYALNDWVGTKRVITNSTLAATPPSITAPSATISRKPLLP